MVSKQVCQKDIKMEDIYKNHTKLTLDMYREGISDSYKASHRLLRALSFAYAIIMLLFAYVFFNFFWLLASLIFLLLGVIIIFWNVAGYKLGTKKSFLRFAALHSSHYQVEIDYYFRQEGLMQETAKTELFVKYGDMDIVYDTDNLILIVYNKKVIIVDKCSFIDGYDDDVLKFIQDKGVRVRKI